MNLSHPVDPRVTLDKKQLSGFLEAALEATDICRKKIREIVATGFVIERKPDKSLVTTADIECEKAFRLKINQCFSSHGIKGEELPSYNPGSEFQWIIDPIDGTAEFARGIPLYGTIIGLYYRGEPIVGVIDHEALDQRYYGAYGLGSFYQGKQIFIDDIENDYSFDGSERIATASRRSFNRYQDDNRFFDSLVNKFSNIRVYSSCFSHSSTLLGATWASVEWNVRDWDLAAARLLIEEAGGAYVKYREINWPGAGELQSVVFGKSKLVDEIVTVLRGCETPSIS